MTSHDRHRRVAGAVLASLVAVLASAVAAIGGCASPAPPARSPGVIPPPQLDTPEQTPAPLPASPVGVGTLIYRGFGTEGTPTEGTLVVADGRRFVLPQPPPGEGRQGTMLASLSPDGRWLGLRAARYPGDQRYEVRGLAGGGVTQVNGEPVRWSPDSRFLLVRAVDEARLTLVEPGIGEAHRVDVPADLVPLVVGVFPDGRLLTAAVGAGSVELDVISGSGIRRVRHVFASSDQDECWCPVASPPVISLDRERVYLPVAHRAGVVPGTTVKATATPEWTTGIAVIDLTTGAVSYRIDAPAGQLVGDIADGLVMVVRQEDRIEVILIKQSSGAEVILSTLPASLTVAVPGQTLVTTE